MGEPSFDILHFDTKKIQITQQLGPVTFVGKINSKSFANSVFRFSQKQNASNIEPIDFFVGVNNITDLWSPSLVPISYACYGKDRKQFIIVSKMFKNGNLAAYIETNQQRSQWTPTVGAKTILGLAHALRTIHSRGIAHTCIQPTKILFDEKMNPHLIDVWLSESPQDVRYMPPEMMGAAEADPMAADIFAFGLLYYHIASGISPFDGIYQANIGPYFFSGQRPPIPSNVSKFSRNLINDCWHHDPKQRPSADELYQTLLEHYNEIVLEVKFAELTEYVKMLVKYPVRTFLSRMGEPKACQKMADYLKEMDIIHASQHYAKIAKTYQMSAAPKRSKGKGQGNAKAKTAAQEEIPPEPPAHDTMDEGFDGILEIPEHKELPQIEMPEPFIMPDEEMPIPEPLQIGSNIMQPMGQPIPIPAGQIIMQPVMINGRIMMQPMLIQQNAPIPQDPQQQLQMMPQVPTQPPNPAPAPSKKSGKGKGKKKSNASKTSAASSVSQAQNPMPIPAPSSVTSRQIPYYDINQQMDQMMMEELRQKEKQRIEQLEQLRLQNEKLKMEQMQRENERIRLENQRLMQRKLEEENRARINAMVKENQERNQRERELQVQFAEQHQSAIREALLKGKSPARIDTATFETFDTVTNDSSLSFSSISREDMSKYNFTAMNKKPKKTKLKKKSSFGSKPFSPTSTDTIFEAAEKGDMREIMRFIEEDNIDPNLQDSFRSTPLHLACENGHDSAAFYLVTHGADVMKTDKWRKTPLHWAAQNGHVQIMKMLVANGADLNAQDKWKDTPLHLAAEKNQPDAVTYLLQTGADPNFINEAGKKPIETTQDAGIRETLNRAMRG